MGAANVVSFVDLVAAVRGEDVARRLRCRVQLLASLGRLPVAQLQSAAGQR